MVDTHCHLDFDRFDEDREIVLQNARQAGLNRILNPGIDLESSRAAIKLADQFEEIFIAVGIHPNSARSWDVGSLKALTDLAIHPKVVAIGEIGLDYYRDWAPRDEQKSVFLNQLNLAAELGLPVIIHTRDKSPDDRQASEDVLDMLADWHLNLIAENSSLSKAPGVLHSYSSGPEFLKRVFALNFFIGITGPITYPNARDLQQVVASAPLGNVVIETDAPFLTPQQFRGKRNEPAHVNFVAEKIAQIRNLPFDTIADNTTANAERLFHW